MAKGVAETLIHAGPASSSELGRGLRGRRLQHRQKGAKTRRRKGTKCMVVFDGNGVPVGAQLASAQLAECRLAESTPATVIVRYRKYIRNRRFEYKRRLHRFRKRWKIERTNAWLQNFRRIQMRYDRIITVFQGFFHFAWLIIALKYLCNYL